MSACFFYIRFTALRNSGGMICRTAQAAPDAMLYLMKIFRERGGKMVAADGFEPPTKGL